MENDDDTLLHVTQRSDSGSRDTIMMRTYISPACNRQSLYIITLYVMTGRGSVVLQDECIRKSIARICECGIVMRFATMYNR